MRTPNVAGFYRVNGRRKSNGTQYRPVRTVVEVRRYQWGAKWGLAVYFCGRQNPYRIDAFDAEWTRIDVEFAEGIAQ